MAVSPLLNPIQKYPFPQPDDARGFVDDGVFQIDLVVARQKIVAGKLQYGPTATLADLDVEQAEGSIGLRDGELRTYFLYNIIFLY
jgi:hypothetical protein